MAPIRARTKLTSSATIDTRGKAPGARPLARLKVGTELM